MKEIIELQSPEWQSIYSILTTLDDSIATENQTKDQLKTALISMCGLSSIDSDTLSQKLINNYKKGVYADLYVSTTKPSLNNEEDDMKVFLSQLDLNYIHDCYKENQDDDLTKMLIAFILYYRKNYHPSRWIHYDRKTILYLAGLLKKSIKEQNNLTNYLHSHYNLNMQVVGSKQPIPCFTLLACNTQSPLPGIDENPWINVGDFNPFTVNNILKQIKDSKDQ